MLAQLEWERNGKPGRLTIAKQPVYIGTRGEVSGDSPQLAQQHCRVAHDGTQFFVEHVTGIPTRVNGSPIQGRHVLADGDEIECGDFRVRFTQKRAGATRSAAKVAPQPPPLPQRTEPDATFARLQQELVVYREQVDKLHGERVQRDGELAFLQAQLDSERTTSTQLSAQLSMRTSELTASGRRLEALEADVDEIRTRLQKESARAEALESEVTNLRVRLRQRDEDLERTTTTLATTRNELDAAQKKIDAYTAEGRKANTLLDERDREIAGLNGKLADAEARYRLEQARADGLHDDKDRLELRASQLLEEVSRVRREVDKSRLQAEKAGNALAEANLERDKAQLNLARLTNDLAACQHRLNEALIADEGHKKVLAELRTLIEAQQEELQVIGEARKRVQALYEDLQKRHHSMDVNIQILKGENSKLANENARTKVELNRLQDEIRRLVREHVTELSVQDAALALEALRKELHEAQATIVRLRADTEMFQNLRGVVDAHAAELKK